MATTFRPYEPEQMLLLSPELHDWLAEGHFAHHVGDWVDGLDLTLRMRGMVVVTPRMSLG